jgi:hypothetical protein
MEKAGRLVPWLLSEHGAAWEELGISPQSMVKCHSMGLPTPSAEKWILYFVPAGLVQLTRSEGIPHVMAEWMTTV